MNLKKNFIVIEFEYDFTYLYDVCNKIRKLIKSDLPIFNEDNDPSDAIIFSNEEDNLILRVSPKKTGIMFDLKEIDDDANSEEIIKDGIKIFQKLYPALISILDIREDIDEFNIVNQYTYLVEKEEIQRIGNQIKNITNINRIIGDNGLLGQRISFKHSNDYSMRKFIYKINSDENIEIQTEIKLDKDFDICGLSDEIDKCDSEVNDFIKIE